MWLQIVTIFTIILYGDLADVTSSIKCRKVNRLLFYSGTQNVTKSGKTCQRWDATKPVKPSKSILRLGTKALRSMENYCHADRFSNIPWCYIKDTEERWEHCDLPACPVTGGWSSWSYGCCSFTQIISTGQRVMTKTRACDNPTPLPGGYYCHGTNLEISACPNNIQPCQNKDVGPGAQNCLGPLLIDGHHQYQGTQSVTKSGKTCQRWDSVIYKSSNNILQFYKSSLKSLENYCRTPNERSTPWCYTSDQESSWEDCGIRLCDVNCLGPHSYDGIYPYYVGTQNTTTSGKTCQRWDVKVPHPPSNNIMKFEKDTIKSMKNYCRTPDRYSAFPWCYTTDIATRWEHCGIPRCDVMGGWSNWVSGCCSLTLSTETGRPMMTRSRKCLITFPWIDMCKGDNFEVVECDKDALICSNAKTNTKAANCIGPEIDGKYYYQGTQSVTKNKNNCQRWDSVTPDILNINISKAYTKDRLKLFENYCRTLNDYATPWCYTTNSNTIWEECGIPHCDDNCLGPKIGGYYYYKGTQSVSHSGKSCQYWNNNKNKNKYYTNKSKSFFDTLGNYCRTPDYLDVPWCYTNDPNIRWEVCGIPQCETNGGWSNWVSGCCSTKTGMMTRKRKCLNIFYGCEGNNMEVIKCDKYSVNCRESLHGYFKNFQFKRNCNLENYGLAKYGYFRCVVPTAYECRDACLRHGGCTMWYHGSEWTEHEYQRNHYCRCNTFRGECMYDPIPSSNQIN